MTARALANPLESNSVEAARRRVVAGTVTWGPVVTVLLSRTLLALTVQGLLALGFLLSGEPAPWQATIRWWSIYGTAIDLGCLAFIAWGLQREGLHIQELLRSPTGKLGRDTLLGLGILVVLFPIAIVGTAILSGLLVYGVMQPVVGPGLLTDRHLPLWAVIYSLGIWWVIWTVTEELTYNGYVMPRLEALTGKPALTVAVVGFFWAFHHVVFPLMLDWRYMAWRFLIFVPVAVIFPVLYRRLRYLRPIVFGHWMMDFLAAVTTIALRP